MDIKQALQTQPHDPAWLDRYVEHLDTCPEPTGTFDKHHILPQAIFPAFKSLKKNPWNCAALSPSDHLMAHYYLFKAFPGNFNAVYAFRLMVGRGLLDHVKNDESLVREIALAYEQVRFGRENVPNVKGWVRLYRGDDEATVVPPDEVEHLVVDGWTRTKPAGSWVNNGVEDRQVRTKDLQGWLDQGYTLGRLFTHTPEHRDRVGVWFRQYHAERRGEAGAYEHLPHGDQHHSRRLGIPDDVRAKISATLTGKTQSPEHVEKRRQKVLGMHWSWGACTAARKLRSEAISGEKNHWHGTRGPMGGRRHAALTVERMSASHKANYQNPEFAARMKAVRPRGEDHYLYGSNPAPETCAKIAASLTGRVQSEATIAKRSGSQEARAYDAIPESEHRAFEQAIKVKTEEEMLLIRRLYPTNSRPYNIITGLMHIRLNRTSTVEVRYWQQAAAWLHYSGHTPELKGTITCVTPISTRLGTGHGLIPGQPSAHDLRKVGLSKGVTRARQAYELIPTEERDALLAAWDSQSALSDGYHRGGGVL